MLLHKKGLYAHYCRLCYAIDLGAKHNESCLTICCCGFLALAPLRTKIRTERNIEGSICKDIMVSIIKLMISIEIK